ncbi:MAG: Mak16 protein C-terminal region-domain-containing protein, partial [Olpidium bornovanus]
MRRLRMKAAKKTLIPINRKVERREKRREQKAEIAARLDKSIEKELLDRLRTKAYGDAPLNVNEDVWKEILEGEKEGLQVESDESEEDDEDAEDEIEDSDFGGHEFVEDDEESEEEMENIFEFDGDENELEGGAVDEDDASSADEMDGTRPKKYGAKRKGARRVPLPGAKKRRGAHVEV